ncbi:outer membrane protein assembly factor BamE domain-containing protein [Ursidibacter arcticus]
MKKLLSILFVCTFLSNCGSLPPNTNYETLSRSLTVGMTKQEVISILGEPTSKEIKGKKETYNYDSTGVYRVIYQISPVPLPSQSTSYLHAYFDENGLLESFSANTY